MKMQNLIPLAWMLAPAAFAQTAAAPPIKVEVPATEFHRGAGRRDPPRILWHAGLSKVSRPTLQVFRPAPARANGTAILIFPGGGYQAIAYDTMQDQTIGPLQDAQQAMRVVRQHADMYWTCQVHR